MPAAVPPRAGQVSTRPAAPQPRGSIRCGSPRSGRAGGPRFRHSYLLDPLQSHAPAARAPPALRGSLRRQPGPQRCTPGAADYACAPRCTVGSLCAPQSWLPEPSRARSVTRPLCLWFLLGEGLGTRTCLIPQVPHAMLSAPTWAPPQAVT